MAIDIELPPGATPLDPDEADGLIPTHISTQIQLNEWELANIIDGERWAFARRRGSITDPANIRTLHRKMFGDTWRWAGTYRTTGKNIGVDASLIASCLHDLCADVTLQLRTRSLALDDIAMRFSHRLVAIHPFANGNGRLSRTAADLLLVREGAPRFSWGGGSLATPGQVRERYLRALRQADAGDYAGLLQFVRS